MPSFNDIRQEKHLPQFDTKVTKLNDLSHVNMDEKLVSKTSINFDERVGDIVSRENVYSKLNDAIYNTQLPDECNRKFITKPSMFTFGRTNSERAHLEILDESESDGNYFFYLKKKTLMNAHFSAVKQNQLSDTQNKEASLLINKDSSRNIPSKMKLMQITSNEKEKMLPQPYRADQKFTKAIQTTEIYKTFENTISDQLYMKKGDEYEYSEACRCLHTCPCALQHQKPLKSNVNQFNLTYTSTSTAPFNFSAHYSHAKAQLNVTKATDIQFSIEEK